MKFTKHLIGYAPVKLLAMLCSFGGIYVYTRLLSPDEYGLYALMFSAMALLHMLTLTWVEASSFRMGGQVKTDQQQADHFKTAVCLMLVSLVIVTVLLAVGWVLTSDYPQYQKFIPFMAVLLPLNTLIKIAMEAHRARQNVVRYMISASAKLLLGFVIGVLMAWKAGMGALAPFAGLASAAIVLALIEGRWVLVQAVKGTTDSAAFKRWALFGIPAAFAIGLDLLLSSADRFLIAYFLDEAAVGSYAAGYGVADKTVLFLIAWVAMAGAPLLMEAYEAQDRDIFRKRARDFINLIVLAGLPVATGIALVAEPLADAMIGESLRDTAKMIIPWIAFSGLLNGILAFYVAESFHLTHKTRLKATLLLIPLCLNIVLNIFLIPRFELFGAVWATILSYGLAVILLGSVGRRLVALPVPLKDIALVALACAAMIPVRYIDLGWGPWADLFAMAAAGAVIYGTIIFGFNITQCRTWIKSLITKRVA